MIKIEITDIENIDVKTLWATGMYLCGLSEKNVHKHPSEEPSACMKRPYTAPKLTPLSVDDQLDMMQLSKTNFTVNEMTDIIEEEMIPVLPELVTIPAVPSAAEIFNPVNSLSIPPFPKSPIDLDTDGMPWDLRIHARTKTKMKDGSWKKLRGVGPEIVKKVEAELKAVQSIPAPPPLPVEAVVGLAGVPSVAGFAGFAELMALVTKSITEGKLKRDQVVFILKPFGIPSLPLVSGRPDLIPAIIARLNEVINAAQ